MAISTVRTIWPKSGNFGQNRVKSENSTILPAVLCKFLSKKNSILNLNYSYVGLSLQMLSLQIPQICNIFINIWAGQV